MLPTMRNFFFFAKSHGVGLVVVGLDNAVVDGIEGYFRGSKL